MNWFLNLPTRIKLLIIFGVPIFLLLVVSMNAYRIIKSLQEEQTRLYREEFTDATDILAFRANTNAIHADMMGLVMSEARERENMLRDIREHTTRVDEVLSNLLERSRVDQVFNNRLQQLSDLRGVYERTREEEVMPRISQGRLEEARKLMTGVQEQRYEHISDLSLELSQERMRRAAAAVVQSERLVREEARVILLIALMALALSIFLAWWLSSIIARPVSDVAAVAERVARGDLTAQIPKDGRGDEIGLLQQSFHRMIDGLRNINREIAAGVEVLALASSEIMSASTQLAASAAQTAAAVNQTSVTVEHVKQTAELSSQKARHVSETANRAALVSSTGRKSVDELIESMTLIRDQMESIAESIVRLSEQSQTIGEIISTVNDLAEQSNLLAVNAAIEAAKAGEQGKGFAVVAHEMRNLAEQSKQATAQVREILTDIQKATTAAAVAAEQGRQTVEAGMRRSGETREAIRTLENSVIEASQAATQIAVSSQQQTVGIDQVAMAMGSIKQVSQQYALSSRQTEGAARELYSLGQKLKQVVEQYRE